MIRGIHATVVSVIALTLGVSAAASTTFVATLTNSQESPPTNPTFTGGAPRVSSGTATFVLNDAQTQMTMSATIVGIDVNGNQTPTEPLDNLAAAHIHAGGNTPPVTNGVVWGFFGSPFNDNAPNDFQMVPAATGTGGTFTGKWDEGEGNAGTTLSAQLANIFAGRAYINFHTAQFGSGEIRGALLLVPEPSTAALLLVSAGGALVSRRRRA